MRPDPNIMQGWVEAVPNFSEGRDPEVLAALTEAVSASGALLLDQTADPDHHRAVLTFCGPPSAVQQAALAVAQCAAERIDLTRHRGEHPRLGALDVLPFVPLGGTTMAECAALAHATGELIWSRLGLPVYFYEAAALRPECRRLENVRRGGFEAPELPPDLGSLPLHPTAGAVIVGARKFLIAFNVNLATPDLAVAQSIARAVRASSGGLPAVKALGLQLASRGLAQVSMNLTDFKVTPLALVFETVVREARARGVDVAGSELIGLIPRAALESVADIDLRWENFSESMILENRIAERLHAAGRAGAIHLE